MDRFTTRCDKLRKTFVKAGVDSLLVTNFVNVTYLTGFTGDDSFLLVTGDTAPDRLRNAEASGLPILHKPLNPARLRTLIANLLREHSHAA